ncbi:bifunctional phosphoserine phosphatase/homoserine phosphotransferase ThrH [Lichenibacterium minor]|uniref:phosphoserine phosphatase n=1 Tax=Lichenibacterium minor TaxID=2316528 RepID=A0A4Q2U945_9HYPH|nr:bifunctional phosphoserine phosphatase/homoserine phosphotransferase ThrH [Lichenibacterium minor]RYC33303.1 bifunctional phosphoserine phosphatase/homoserine phosphotransferase ThrH [Lichenibacterium minor]
MTGKPHACVDLEGVPAPGIWPFLADRLGIAALRPTTREVGDDRALMEQRIAALRRLGITLARVLAIVSDLHPFPGAVDVLKHLASVARVVIVTDSFDPMNRALLDRLPSDAVLCHSFTHDEAGLVRGMAFWNALEGKHLCFDRFATDGSRTLAVGDALNDLSMIRRASVGVLFRPPAVTLEKAGDVAVAHDDADILSRFRPRPAAG